MGKNKSRTRLLVPDKISAMTAGGAKLGHIRRRLISLLKPGFDLIKIESIAQKLIHQAGATPNFAKINNYGFATCIMVNDEVVHCQPCHRLVRLGDLVTIDVGLEWQKWHLDSADSCLVGKPDDRFISVGRQALKKAIAEALPGRRIGHISQAMQQIIEKDHYSPVTQYCGHGIGRALHENPQIPCHLTLPISKTIPIYEGMTLAIEVMLNEGRSEIIVEPDGWHSHTADKSRSAQFEHTILVTSGGPRILTL